MHANFLVIGALLAAPASGASGPPPAAVTAPAAVVAPAQDVADATDTTGALSTSAAVVPAPTEVIMLRLRDGSIRWGAIEEHSSSGLRFRLLDTGGVASVDWRFLDPAQDLELRTRFGYVDTTGDEEMIEADKLVLRSGDEVIGKIVGRTDQEILLKVRGTVLPVPTVNVRSASSGLQVPALDVYTKDELYNLERATVDLEDAAQQWELARFCERILDFQRALEHYQAVAELDPDFQDGSLEAVLARVTIKAERQEQVDYLNQVDHLKRRKRYSDALDQLVAFDGLYPDSPLAEDRNKLEKRVLEARAEHAADIVRLSWFRRMERLAAQAAREMGYEGALAYLDDAMRQDLLSQVTDDVRKIWPDVPDEAIAQLWLERDRGRWRPASYGLGTWLLGEDGALAGLEASEEPKEQQSDTDAQRAALDERLNRFLKNQESQRRARRSQEQDEDVEAYWAQLPHSARTNWLVAYFVENSGLFDLREKPELHNCRECGGTGVREVIYTGSARSDSVGGGTQRQVCETCKGIGRTRRIRYR